MLLRSFSKIAIAVVNLSKYSITIEMYKSSHARKPIGISNVDLTNCRIRLCYIGPPTKLKGAHFRDAHVCFYGKAMETASC